MSSSLTSRANFDNKMNKFFKKVLTDCQESYNELVHKVSWPSKSELANSTVIVMVASIIMSIVIWLVDLAINQIMHLIYNIPVA